MAGTSGSKNSHGQEIEVNGSEKVMANNSFAVLNTIEEEETLATDKGIENHAVIAKVLSEDGEEVEEETVQAQEIARFVEGVFLEAESLPQDEGLNPEKEVKLVVDGCKTLNKGQETEEAEPQQVDKANQGPITGNMECSSPAQVTPLAIEGPPFQSPIAGIQNSMDSFQNPAILPAYGEALGTSSDPFFLTN
ncbi:hypothetical protein FRX31_028492, partial [Thalictrum thalictroides]